LSKTHSSTIYPLHIEDIPLPSDAAVMEFDPAVHFICITIF